jgi:hypothetical protein
MIRTISYADLAALFRRKFAEYDAHMCDRALRDCYDAMLAVGETTDPEYARKLWCEIDAIRDRQMLLKRKGAYA